MGHGGIHFKNGLDSGLDISFYFLTLRCLNLFHNLNKFYHASKKF